jgi:L-ascorbate metabolism protein UlaG (beta-lactamase superfamily)
MSPPSEGRAAPKRTPSGRPAWRRRARRILAIASALVGLFVLVVLVDGWVAFGKGAEGERRARMHASPQWDDGGFQNPQPLWNDGWGMITGLFSKSDFASPDAPLPVVPGDRSRFAEPPASGLRITWLGHSTLLVEIDGATFLTDPVWGERSSPLSWLGPRRWYAPPIALAELPRLDAVILSHDHYDHLDYPTISALAGSALAGSALADADTTFVAPLGVGAHLAYWGVPEDRIVELDWWDRITLAGVEVVCTPARHASGRTLFDKDATLWAGWAMLGPSHRAWFSGDTGLFPAMRTIGEELGPFDVTMIEAGAYGAAWPDWHLGPEQAVKAHEMVRGDVLVPVHWGLFDLAYHGWTEPVERVLAAARPSGTTVLVPRPGESFEPTAAPALARWWPEVPWQTAEDDPIVATKMDE